MVWAVGDPTYELKRRKGATPLAKGPRHTSVMALPTLPGSLDMTVWSSVYGGYFSRWTSFIIKIFIWAQATSFKPIDITARSSVPDQI